MLVLHTTIHTSSRYVSNSGHQIADVHFPAYKRNGIPAQSFLSSPLYPLRALLLLVLQSVVTAITAVVFKQSTVAASEIVVCGTARGGGEGGRKLYSFSSSSSLRTAGEVKGLLVPTTTTSFFPKEKRNTLVNTLCTASTSTLGKPRQERNKRRLTVS